MKDQGWALHQDDGGEARPAEGRGLLGSIRGVPIGVPIGVAQSELPSYMS